MKIHAQLMALPVTVVAALDKIRTESNSEKSAKKAPNAPSSDARN